MKKAARPGLPLVGVVMGSPSDWETMQYAAQTLEAFGVPLPVAVIAHALNVPPERMADFKRWSDDSIAGIGTNLSLEGRLRAERGRDQAEQHPGSEAGGAAFMGRPPPCKPSRKAGLLSGLRPPRARPFSSRLPCCCGGGPCSCPCRGSSV